MERKTEVVRSLVRSGELKQALKIAKDFRLGISKPDSDAMKLAYECMVHERFYKQLGYNLSEKVAEGVVYVAATAADNGIRQALVAVAPPAFPALSVS